MKRSRERDEEKNPEVSIGLSDGRRLEEEAAQPATKITGLDESASETTSEVVMRCSLPPHREVLSFLTYGEYEAHYSHSHTNRCAECHKNFPSEHLLNIHFEDCHDAFAAVRRDRGELTYSCFVEGCDRKCRTPFKRRNHLIDKHMYPKNYFFALTKEGIDGRHSLLVLDGGRQRRRSSAAAAASGASKTSQKQSLRRAETPEVSAEDKPMEAAEPASLREPSQNPVPVEAPDVDMDSLSSAMSSLQFVPVSVRFGRGKGKSGFAKR